LIASGIISIAKLIGLGGNATQSLQIPGTRASIWVGVISGSPCLIVFRQMNQSPGGEGKSMLSFKRPGLAGQGLDDCT